MAEVLRAEVSKPSWKREHVALGTNTDPYQRSEGRYALMPGIIRALADSGTPFSILTKGPLLKRDLPLLVEAAQKVPVSVAVSLAIMDTELQQKVEPGTPDSRARLESYPGHHRRWTRMQRDGHADPAVADRLAGPA